MASIRRILGIVVLVIGVLILALSYTVFDQYSETIPNTSASGSILVLTPQILGGGTVKLSWSGASSNTSVTVFGCTDSTCSSLSSTTPVAKGTGGSGSLSFSVSGYSAYAVAETGNPGSLSATAAVEGLSVLGVIGIVLAIVGAILVAIPVRARAPVMEDDSTAAPPEDEEGAEETVVAAAPAPAAAASAAPGPGARPPIKCANCGTMNEPWITNCRWCKRPLTSTAPAATP